MEIRTPDLCFTKALGDSTTGETTGTYDGTNSTPSHNPSSRQQNDPDLALVIDAWPSLADAVKAGILAMVRVRGD